MQNYVGKQIDRYRITERLGMGGMAVAYKAYDTRLERDVALKLIRTDEIPPSQYDRMMKRFEREAKAQAKFDHSNIVHIYDYGEVDGSPFLVMAYVSGGTLKQKTGKPIDVQTAIEWVTPIADALAYAHEHGVIHRDIKPSNILFDDKGKPVLTDFGIAKILETDEATLTGTGMGVGTPEYMAPEQWQGKPCEASDQYALGVVLYELITGQKPYSADTPAAIILMQATEPLPAPSKIVQGIPEAVEKVLYKALARRPEDRYEDMGAFQKALEGRLDELQAKSVTPEERPQLIPEMTATRTLEVEDDYETVGEVPESLPSTSQQSQQKTETPPEIDIPLPVVDSEGETRDALEPIVKPQGGSRKLKGKKTGKKLPRWVVWGGIGIVSLILIGVILAAALGAFGAGNDEPVSELPISVSEGLLETTQPATETVLASPTFTLVLSPTITNTATNAPTFTPTLGIGSVMPNDIDKAEMVYVPAGGFTMGSEASDAYSDESPEHWVTLDAYWIYKTEVTNAQYAQFLNLNVSGNKVEGGETWLDDDDSDVRIQEIDSIWVPNEGYEDHPVIEVTWYGAQAYCDWAGGSLPTEAQWEKAARGEESLYPYPWGNDNLTCDLAQYDGCSGSTVPVDSFPQGASPYGARNMAGNVWEWVADWYDENYYSSSLTDNPTGPDTDGIYRVLRGGSWFNNVRNLRVSYRVRYGPDYSDDDIGFRCLLLP